jgi:hypothetical protein
MPPELELLFERELHQFSYDGSRFKAIVIGQFKYRHLWAEWGSRG